jgi:LacI family transcriptional regulator
MKRPGIREVVRVAGVSSATVSYVLSGRGRVSEGTRHRVIEAATALGYIRDDSVAGLRTGESKLVDVILNNIPTRSS